MLAVHRPFAPAIGVAQIASVGLHIACLHHVGQVSGQNIVVQVTNQFGIPHGKHHLDPAVQVSRHQVGAAEINLLTAIAIAGVPEIVDPAVLQETAHNTGYPDVFAHTPDAGTKAAYASHQEINLHAGLRCLI